MICLFFEAQLVFIHIPWCQWGKTTGGRISADGVQLIFFFFFLPETYLTIKPRTQHTCTHTHRKVTSVFMLPAKPCLSLFWLRAKVSKNPLRLLQKLFLFLCKLGKFHSYHCRRKWIGNISVWGWLFLQWELSQLNVEQQLCVSVHVLAG